MHLAMIDDNDRTYLNGVLIGSAFVWNKKRIYEVPEKVLKQGKNVVAIRVKDGGGGGGIYGKDGYPASPFRTDQWKGITEEEKYTVGL
jgi:sialate O-acetylesterase